MMKYIPKPSLQHITYVKIAVSLWMQKDITDLILQFYYSLTSKYESIEDKVLAKVPLLPLPNSIQDKIINFVKSIGKQIFNWMKYSCKTACLFPDVLLELCWTILGTINKKKTAKVLIENKNLDIIKRFDLACMYCFEEDIIKLWNELPKYLRRAVKRVHNYSMVFYWTHKEELGHKSPIYESIFESCAKNGNKTAAIYILQKLTPSQRERSLVRTAIYLEDAEVFFSLLSEMDEEEEKLVINLVPYKLILYLLDFPWQNFFFEVVDRMYKFISRQNFKEILIKIYDKIKYGRNGRSIYEELFKTFWQESPSALKSYVIGDFHYDSLFRYLFHCKDKDKIKFIFQYATFMEKNKVMQNICINFVLEDQLDLVIFLIQELIQSEKIKFKEECERNIENQFWKTWLSNNKDKWDKLFFPSVSVHNSNKKEC